MNWLKIIVIILIVSVVVFIVKTIYAKLKISVLMNSNPESALRTAEKNLETNIFTPEEYECQLTKIANSTGYAGAMLKLADFYIEQNKKFKLADLFISESESGKENKAKSEFWKKRAVKAGDIESITNYYTNGEATEHSRSPEFAQGNVQGCIAGSIRSGTGRASRI